MRNKGELILFNFVEVWPLNLVRSWHRNQTFLYSLTVLRPLSSPGFLTYLISPLMVFVGRHWRPYRTSPT